MEHGTSGLAHTLKIASVDTAGAEKTSVGKVLSSQITDGELGQDDFGATSNNLIELVVDDFPLSVNNLLEVIRVLETDLGAIFLSLKLELKVEADDLR